MMNQDVTWHNGKAYAWCPDCGKLVCLNKTLFGSWHICAGEDQ